MSSNGTGERQGNGGENKADQNMSQSFLQFRDQHTWNSLGSLGSLSAVLGNLPDFYANSNLASAAEKIAGLSPEASILLRMQQQTFNPQLSLTQIPEYFRTLSIKESEKKYPLLPVEWLNQAQLQQPSQAQPLKRANQNSGNFSTNKIPRQNSPDVLSQFRQQVKMEKPLSQTTTDSDPKSSSRWNSWSHEEEVFLVVAVLDRFFRRGSLASSGKASNAVDCWAEIKAYYDRICQAWHEQDENRVKPSLIARSTSALCRHFKIMKVRATEGDANQSNNGNFRKYLREWDTVYNLHGKLIPEEY